ncbi:MULTISPECIES: YraN family protein [unclassified Sphingobacterium]|uniref:YraN family protein n=1 Tax=unclassified Sphingobacterium TaxID=2609468 RepID=UPI0020C33D62|nr:MULTISPECIES: YraN family protein [unclassified Sphingobacterium]
MDRKTTGTKGEEMAVLFLKKIGFQIIELNWRHKNLEVDIIAHDNDVLVFVEVKVRSSSAFGTERDMINSQKQNRLSRAAEAYIMQKDHRGEIRFDVITFIDGKSTYIKDAFWNY